MWPDLNFGFGPLFFSPGSAFLCLFTSFDELPCIKTTVRLSQVPAETNLSNTLEVSSSEIPTPISLPLFLSPILIFSP